MRKDMMRKDMKISVSKKSFLTRACRATVLGATLLGVTFLAGDLTVGIGAAHADDGANVVPQMEMSTTTAAASAGIMGAATTSDYLLGVGDKLRVNVFGEEDLSGEVDVNGTGKVSLPLVGQVQAAGLTIDAFTEEVATKLKEGYLTSPKVSVEVLNYRPFYIIGEVTTPGQYPYTNGMTVLNAVAVAGGFTYRANEDKVLITRGDQKEVAYKLTQAVKVLPGDIVKIPERFF